MLTLPANVGPGCWLMCSGQISILASGAVGSWTAGLEALIVSPSALTFEGGVLSAEGRAIDLVYNRLTDFYFEADEHRAVGAAYEQGAGWRYTQSAQARAVRRQAQLNSAFGFGFTACTGA